MLAVGAVPGIPDYGQTVAVVLSGLTGLVTAVAGLVRIFRERKRKDAADDDEGGPPDEDAPDAHEVWLDVLIRLSDAEEERDAWRHRWERAEAERDHWQRRWGECNDERLTLLRERRPGGRRHGDGS